MQTLAHNIQAHPDDDTVALVTCREDFIAAAKDDRYRIVIWERSEDQKKAFRDKLLKFWTASTDPAEVLQACDAEAFHDGEKLNLSMSFELEDFREEFELMAQLYQEINSPQAGFIFEQLPNWRWDGEFGEHDSHGFPVLNCIWLDQATFWESQSGLWHDAGEGNFYYMKPWVKHSPQLRTIDNAGKPRVTIVCKEPVYG